MSKHKFNAWPYAVLLNGKTGEIIDGTPAPKAKIRQSDYDYFNGLLASL